MRLLDEGQLPSHRVGTHRRLFLKDLSAYQRVRTQKRKSALDKMTKEVVAARLDDRFVDLSRPDGEYASMRASEIC